MGQTVEVKVLELDSEHDRISLSIKALQPNPWESVDEKYPAKGAFEGTVVRKTDFGAFVELEPGLDGLLHVSQLPPGMDLTASELDVGNTVQAWIREVDVENGRIGLTLRRPPDRDPWQRVEMRYQEGQTVEGTVENCADFGVFVELEAGLSALIPISELGLARDADPRESFSPGDAVAAKILSVDGPRQRISLSVKAFKRDQERNEYLGHMDTGSEGPGVTGFGAELMKALEKKK
jgi:small subunit ribosomal protein S1